MNVYEMMNPVPVDNEPVYGYVIEEQHQSYYPSQSQGFVVTAAVSCDYEQLEPQAAYDSDEFLEGMIDILAESDNDKRKLSFSVAYAEVFPEPQAGSNNTNNVVYPTYSCYAVPEATFVNDNNNFEEEIKDLGDFDQYPDCVAAFDSMDLSDGVEKSADKDKEKAAGVNNDLFCVGTIDIDYLRSLKEQDEEKRERRKDAINRWKLKKLKRKAVKAVKQSVTTLQEGAAVACNTLLNARQKATAKRERENGKFKKTKVQWVSVTDLFNSTFDDFK